eukprot:1366894-Amorphochlora_amoeboformis.AAC.1
MTDTIGSVKWKPFQTHALLGCTLDYGGLQMFDSRIGLSKACYTLNTGKPVHTNPRISILNFMPIHRVLFIDGKKLSRICTPTVAWTPSTFFWATGTVRSSLLTSDRDEKCNQQLQTTVCIS